MPTKQLQATTPTDGARPQSKFVDKKDMPAEFGGTPAYWNKAVWKKLLPYYKRGSRVTFLRSDVEEFFAARRVEAA